jgi:hypothetical protein
VSERKRRGINVKERKMVGTNEGLIEEKWEERVTERGRERDGIVCYSPTHFPSKN